MSLCLIDISLELGHGELDRPSNESLRPKLVDYIAQVLAHPIAV